MGVTFEQPGLLAASQGVGGTCGPAALQAFTFFAQAPEFRIQIGDVELRLSQPRAEVCVLPFELSRRAFGVHARTPWQTRRAEGG